SRPGSVSGNSQLRRCSGVRLYSSAQVVKSIRLMVSGASKDSAWFGMSEFGMTDQPPVAAAVQMQVLPGDVPGVHAAQERAGGAELGGQAVPAGGDRLRLTAPRFLVADAGPLRFDGGHLDLAAGVDALRQELVDRHVVPDNLPGQALHHGGQAGPGA